MLEYISPAWAKLLVERLTKLQSKQDEEFKVISTSFGDPILLAKNYIEPKCQHHNPADYNEDEARSYIRSPIFDTINSFFSGDFIERDGRSQMFVLSDAGMGKTSLLMILKLTHLAKFWPQKHNCILLKLEENTIDIIKSIDKKFQTILLLDALDEDPAAWGKIDDRIFKILSVTKNFHRVIISCRTQFFPTNNHDPFSKPGIVVIKGFRCPTLFLSLFDDDQVAKYLEIKFPIKWYMYFQPNLIQNIKILRKQSISVLDKMGSLRLRPLLLSHIDELVNANKTITNSYDVYKALVDIWLQREERKIRERFNDTPCPSQQNLLFACIKIAEYMQTKGVRSISDHQLNDVDSFSNKKNLQYLKNIDIGGGSLLNRNSNGSYRFSHYTIQEYLVARGIVDKIIKHKGKMRPTDQLLVFLELSKCPQMGLNSLNLNNYNLGTHFKYLYGEIRYLDNLSLVGVDFRGAYFKKAHIVRANLDKSNLNSVDLSFSVLTKSSLRHADLRNANLTSADLRGVDLQWANLQGANLTNADLRDTNIDNADFVTATLTNTNLAGVTLSRASFHSTS